MDSFFLEAPADDVVDGVDGHEGAMILFQYDFLELVDLETRDDAVEDLLAVARVAARAVQHRDATAQAVIAPISQLRVRRLQS